MQNPIGFCPQNRILHFLHICWHVIYYYYTSQHLRWKCRIRFCRRIGFWSDSALPEYSRVNVCCASRVNISVTMVLQWLAGVLMICCGGVVVAVIGDQVGQLLDSAPASRIIGVSQLVLVQAGLWLNSAGSILDAAHPQPIGPRVPFYHWKSGSTLWTLVKNISIK